MPMPIRQVVAISIYLQTRLQPGVTRQLTTAHLDDLVELVEAGARRVGVAGTAEARGHAVGTARSAEVEVATCGSQVAWEAH